jgi:hypothetical protein
MNTMKRIGLPLMLAGSMFGVPGTMMAADAKSQDAQQVAQQPPYGMPGPYGMHPYGYGPMMWGGGCGHLREPDMIYGYELMSPKERVEYMDRIHAAKTFEERDKLRYEHYKLMQDRARSKGVTLPCYGPGPGGYYGR